jgi:hypothetical protein
MTTAEPTVDLPIEGSPAVTNAIMEAVGAVAQVPVGA